MSLPALLELLVRSIDKRESLGDVGISSIVSLLHVLTRRCVCVSSHFCDNAYCYYPR